MFATAAAAATRTHFLPHTHFPPNYPTTQLRRIICFGFIQHEGAYLRDEWNMLDFAIVLFSIFDMANPAPAGGSGGSLGALKAVRALRALRPLRAIKKLEGIKQVTTSIFRAIFGCFEVLLITFLFYLIFAILAMNFWSGQLRTCTDPSRTCALPPAYVQPTTKVAALAAACPENLRCEGYYQSNVTTQPWNGTAESLTTGVWMPREWANPSYEGTYMFACNDPAILTQATCKGSWYIAGLNQTVGRHFAKVTRGYRLKTFSFDNVMDAAFTLFEVSTLEMYLDVLYACADATAEYTLPSKNYSQTTAVLYYIIFIILASFFFLNVFVSVVIENFESVKEELDRSAFMTKQQRAWLDAVKKAARTKVSLVDEVPEDAFQLWFYKLVMQPWFDQFIMYCILLNA